MIQQILLAITFVYGPIYLLTLTKLFDSQLKHIFSSITGKDARIRIFKVLEIWFFYFSLCYQSWYWLFQNF